MTIIVFLSYFSVQSDPPRRQSSPAYSVPFPRLVSGEARTSGLVNSFNKMNLRARGPSGNGNVPETHSRSLLGTAHPMSALEPIPQGQELSVHTHLTATHSATLSPGMI
ncbi:unnamed protein product [Echinostoma caproni]|uniref:Secreted protein n=1 Tax=Echinostoma caproni TaxID=27848 RepID=A0A183BBW5_9TREM|nr:unnamed protein product [Echinostoma caproni]